MVTCIYCVAEDTHRVFNKNYKPIKGMTFDDAVQALKSGKKVQRTGWNGKDIYIFMI